MRLFLKKNIQRLCLLLSLCVFALSCESESEIYKIEISNIPERLRAEEVYTFLGSGFPNRVTSIEVTLVSTDGKKTYTAYVLSSTGGELIIEVPKNIISNEYNIEIKVNSGGSTRAKVLNNILVIGDPNCECPSEPDCECTKTTLPEDKGVFTPNLEVDSVPSVVYTGDIITLTGKNFIDSIKGYRVRLIQDTKYVDLSVVASSPNEIKLLVPNNTTDFGEYYLQIQLGPTTWFASNPTVLSTKGSETKEIILYRVSFKGTGLRGEVKPGASFDSVIIDVPGYFDIANLETEIASNGKSIVPLAKTITDYTNPVNVTVIAQNNTEKYYRVFVRKASAYKVNVLDVLDGNQHIEPNFNISDFTIIECTRDGTLLPIISRGGINHIDLQNGLYIDTRNGNIIGEPQTFQKKYDYVYKALTGTSSVEVTFDLEITGEEFAGGDGTCGTNPYLIKLPYQFDNIRNHLSEGACFKIIDNLDFKVIPFVEEGFTPLGSASTPFNGSIDGDGHRIKNMVINKSGREKDHLAIFSYAESTLPEPLLYNLRIDDMEILNGRQNTAAIVANGKDITVNGITFNGINLAGKDYVGLVVASGINTNMSRITVDNTSITCRSNCGSVVGKTTSGIITDITSKTNINAIGDNIGGLIGVHGDGTYGTVSKISNSEFQGNVGGKKNVGGIVGISYFEIDNVKKPSSTISGETSVGGIAGRGYNLKNIDIVTTLVSASGSSVGGVVGDLKGGLSSITVSRSTVSGMDDVGGIAGKADNIASSAIVMNKLNIQESLVAGQNAVGGLFGTLDSRNGVGYELIESSSLPPNSGNNISASASYAGGVIGRQYGDLKCEGYKMEIQNVKATTSYAGGLIGYAEAGLLEVSDLEVSFDAASNENIKALEWVGGVIGKLEGENFEGKNLDVNGGTTSKIRITTTGSKAGGMFGSVSLTNSFKLSGGIVQNLLVKGSQGIVGGLAGFFDSPSETFEATVQNSYISAGIGGRYVGGAVGQNKVANGIIESPGIDLEVKGTTIEFGDDDVGGAFGYTASPINNVITSNITFLPVITGSPYNVARVGGVIGHAFTASLSLSNLVCEDTDIDLYKPAVIKTDLLGGIVGSLSNTKLENSIVENVNVRGNEGVGGVVGVISNNSTAVSHVLSGVGFRPNRNSTDHVSVEGYVNTGGVVGSVIGNGNLKIDLSYAVVKLKNYDENIEGEVNIGGLIGNFKTEASSDYELSNSFSYVFSDITFTSSSGSPSDNAGKGFTLGRYTRTGANVIGLANVNSYQDAIAHEINNEYSLTIISGGTTPTSNYNLEAVNYVSTGLGIDANENVNSVLGGSTISIPGFTDVNISPSRISHLYLDWEDDADQEWSSYKP